MTDQAEYVIEANNLGFQVGKKRLLSGINLKVRRAEHWLVYGMNGCGKTTLFSILAGFQQQTDGTLQVFGEAFDNDNILVNRRRIGFVSSSFFDSRYHHERVIDIVRSGKLGTYGIDWDMTSADHNRAVKLLRAFGLEDKMHQSYDRLSKGQRQNVLIARAFMSKPEILLLDEPCSGLDVLAKARFMDFLRDLMEQETMTILFVSHEISEVKDLFPKTILLRNGRIFAQGNTGTLFTEGLLSQFFQQKLQLKPVTGAEVIPKQSEPLLPFLWKCK